MQRRDFADVVIISMEVRMLQNIILTVTSRCGIFAVRVHRPAQGLPERSFLHLPPAAGVGAYR